MKMTFSALLALAEFASQSPVYAEDLQFRLVNDSSSALVGFNVSPTSSQFWEENLLAGDHIAPGYEAGITIADGLTTCTYDIRGSFADDSEAEDLGLDLCELGEYTFID
ncbi:hypothetical protein HW561_21220 [Rhodobacteraceae bacterium B1Z28]|uniref:Argininosuccinate lyase n=1 Tax=Ruegeria haliotis TaxID=2747601 RepID=A0ABX2PXF1_9RHOB|nr:hypothetical protein [Ruegeria haliotis]NVO58310.1 hypothetical protein [Ruegeria haliotis]